MTRAVRCVLMEKKSIMLCEAGLHREPELNQLGDTDALYLEVQHKVGGLPEDIMVYSVMLLFNAVEIFSRDSRAQWCLENL